MRDHGLEKFDAIGITDTEYADGFWNEQINSMPTLLAFDRQEAQLETKVTNVEDLKRKQFLIEWIEREAKRHGEGGGGGGGLGGLLGSIFGR